MSELLSRLDSAAQIVVHASWQAALLAAIVFIVCGTLRKRLPARWKAALWLVVLARFVLPIVPPSPTSLFNLTRTSTTHVGSIPEAVDSPTSHLSERPALSERGLMRQRGQVVAEPVKLVESPAESAPSTITWKFGMGRGASLVWLAGALGLLLRLAISQFRLGRILRSCDDSADPALQSLLASCRAELRLSHSVRLLLAPRAMSPAVVGIWRPTVVLPKDILQTLSADELRTVMLHELAHIRRRDMLVHWLAALAGAVHWFNPVMWFVARRLAALQELACDEDVLARVEPSLQTGYGHAILKVAELLRSRSPLPSALGAAYGFGLLKERISAISNYRPTSRLGTCFACLLMGALIATGLTDSVSPLTYGDDSPNGNSTRELILQTWKQRESQCASVRFAWKQVVHAQAEALPQVTRARPDSSRPRPGEILTVQQNCSLCLDGERWDFRLDTVGGNRVDGPVGYRDSFDGTLSWHDSGTSAPGKDGTGAVFGPREKRPLSASSLPLCLFARLGVARLDVFDLSRAELAGESHLINGVKCRMLRAARKLARASEQIYVDVDKGCLVRRYEVVVDGHPRLTIDLDYVADPQLGWRPAKWRLLNTNPDGSTVWESVCTATKDDFQAKFDANDFIIPFREGTLVEDRTAPEQVTVRVGKKGFVPAAGKPEPDQKGPGNKPAAGTKSATGKREEYTFPITVSGHAVNRDGKPVSGATIYLASPRNRPRPLAQTQTDASGAYRFEAIGLPIEPA